MLLDASKILGTIPVFPATRNEIIANVIRIQRQFAWMRVTCQAALNSSAARQLVREGESLGFEDCYVQPFEFQGHLLGWRWAAEKPSPI